jgi:quinol monooxygenase YgiN
VADFIEIADTMIKNSNAEPGCVGYMFHQYPYDKISFIAVEFWKDQAATDLHNNSAHFKAFIDKISLWQSVQAEIEVLDVVSK